MTEHDNDGFYWEPEVDFPLRQGDLLFNVPLALMPSRPEFVLRPPEERQAEIEPFDGFPENAPSNEIVAEARWGVLSMVVTPTCHVSEGEKDEDVVAVVPVEPLHKIVSNRETKQQVRSRASSRPHHLFYLPATKLGGGSCRSKPLRSSTVLDLSLSTTSGTTGGSGFIGTRGTTFRKQLARFWPRVVADDELHSELEAKIKNDAPLERLE